MLSTVALWFNVFALAVSLCLALYLVTRDPRNRLAWMASLTTFSLAALFLNNALSIQVPDSSLIPWLRMFSLFSLPFWLNLAVLLGREQVGRASSGGLDTISRIAVPAAYLLSGALIIAQVFDKDSSFIYTTQALKLADWQTGPLYPIAAVVMLAEGLLSIANLVEVRNLSQSAIMKRQFAVLLSATLLSGLGALYIAAGSWLGLETPALAGDILIFVGVVLLAFAVARYNALIQGRIADKDLLYVFALIGSLTFIIVVIALWLFLRGHEFSFVTLMLVMIIAISSLMLYDGIRSALDRIFYRGQYQKLRANLRAMAREAGSGRSLSEQLQTVLRALILEYDLSGGFIALAEDTEYTIEATRQSLPLESRIGADSLAADAIRRDVGLPGVKAAASNLLVPIYSDEGQVGALVLETGGNSQVLEFDDLLLLEELADELAGIISSSKQQEAYLEEINSTVEAYRTRERSLQRQVDQLLDEEPDAAPSSLAGVDDRAFRKLVEDALRHLDDYTYLGEQELAGMTIVALQLSRSDPEFVTLIDKGKALGDVLLLAINKLKPAGEEPSGRDLPTREWYQYIVLHDAYVEGVMNRDIMSRLYVSEGTFNRSRRQAVRGVAGALQEMEKEAVRRNDS